MNKLDTLTQCLPSGGSSGFDWAAIERLPELRPIISGLSQTPQSPKWHGEGNVWTHTRLVCEALLAQPEFKALDDYGRLILALAALFHDFGKLKATRFEDGDWTAPYHGLKGAQLVRSLLWTQFGLCGSPEAQQIRETVCNLVRYHGLPLHIIDQSESYLYRVAAIGALTPRFNIKILSILSTADVLGRIAPDTAEQLERIELCRMYAAEHGCYESPVRFGSDYTQRRFFAGGSVAPGDSLYNPSWGEVIMMCGLPGTGKDTWIAHNCSGMPVISLDDIRAELGIRPDENQGQVIQCAKQRAKEYLRAKQPFIWNATSLTNQRSQQIDLFEAYGTCTRIVYLETGWDENLRRNAERKDAVPEYVIESMLDKLEPPLSHEACHVEWICV